MFFSCNELSHLGLSLFPRGVEWHARSKDHLRHIMLLSWILAECLSENCHVANCDELVRMQWSNWWVYESKSTERWFIFNSCWQGHTVSSRLLILYLLTIFSVVLVVNLEIMILNPCTVTAQLGRTSVHLEISQRRWKLFQCTSSPSPLNLSKRPFISFQPARCKWRNRDAIRRYCLSKSC